MTTRKNILVIGAGIAGCSVSYYLSRAGFKVTLVDQDNSGDNCSYGNAGLIVPSHYIPLAAPGMVSKGLKLMLRKESPFSLKLRLNSELMKWGWHFIKASSKEKVKKASPVLLNLLMRNRQLLLELEEKDRLRFGLKKNGLLMLCSTKEGFEAEKEVIRQGARLGLNAEILSAGELEKLESNIQMNVEGAGYYPDDAHFQPELLMDGLKNVLEERGVEILNNTRINGIVKKESLIHCVKTEDGNELPCSDVIFCTGAYTSQFNKMLGVAMPMQAGKGYSITLKNPRKTPKISVMFSEAYVAVTPMNGSLRFAGTMEMGGFDKRINQHKVNAIKNSVSRYLPDYSPEDFEGQPVWVGFRPCTPDGLPYVGRIKPYQNAYVSAGHAMLGMSLGLVCGEMIAQIIQNKPSTVEHELLRPNRYH